MQVVIEGRDLPGRRFEEHRNVHVAVQVGRRPEQPVPGDAASARWELEVRVDGDDFRGPAVQGRRGDRFLYLTWGSPDGEEWGMFRRAKLMLNRIDPELVAAAADGTLVATVSLTDGCGGPRCARVDPPAVRWRVGAPRAAR